MGFQLGESFSFLQLTRAIKVAIVLKLNISSPDRALLKSHSIITPFIQSRESLQAQAVFTHAIWIQFNHDAELVKSNSETRLKVNKDKPVNLEFRIVISLILFYLNMMDYSMSFLSLSTWNDFLTHRDTQGLYMNP